MSYNGVNISIPISFEIKTPPRGMIDYDPIGLKPDQQRELNDYKLSIRKGNWLYITDHPELKAIVSMVIRMVTLHRPRNIVEFVAKLFTRPERQIRKEVSDILNERKIEYKPIPSDVYEDWDY